MRRLWIGLEVGVAILLSAAALAWFGREIDRAPPTQRDPAMRQSQAHEKEAKKFDPLPRAEHEKALVRLLLLLGLARGH